MCAFEVQIEISLLAPRPAAPAAAIDPNAASAADRADGAGSANNIEEAADLTQGANELCENDPGCSQAAAVPRASDPGRFGAFIADLTGAVSSRMAPWGAWLVHNAVAVVGWFWLAGSGIWFLRQALIALKFSRRLALATPAAPALQEQADALARAMGLSCRPPVMIVRDVISPMLWG